MVQSFTLEKFYFDEISVCDSSDTYYWLHSNQRRHYHTNGKVINGTEIPGFMQMWLLKTERFLK
jgi:hypothetical protein